MKQRLSMCLLVLAFCSFRLNRQFVSCHYTIYKKCENNTEVSEFKLPSSAPSEPSSSSYLYFFNKIYKSASTFKSNFLNVWYGHPKPKRLFLPENGVGRTFFALRRRMQLFMWLPISFKLGVIVTLLLVLTTMSLKTLLIGFIILFLLLSRTNGGHAKLWGPPRTAAAELLPDAHRNVHIHIHTSPGNNHQAYVEPWWHQS